VEVPDFPDAAAWEAWLAGQHAVASGAWLRIAKRRSGIATIGITDFDRLGRSERYALMLPLLKARTAESRARALAGVVTKLGGVSNGWKLPRLDSNQEPTG
jgi:hypothetical protein